MKRNASSLQPVSIPVSKQPLLDPGWQTQSRHQPFAASSPAPANRREPAPQASQSVGSARQKTPLETGRSASCSKTLPVKGPRSVDRRSSRRISGSGEVLRGNHPPKGRIEPKDGWRGTRGGRPDRTGSLSPLTRTVAISAVPQGGDSKSKQTRRGSHPTLPNNRLAPAEQGHDQARAFQTGTPAMKHQSSPIQHTQTRRGNGTPCYSLSSQATLQHADQATAKSDWLSYAFMGVMLACTFLV